MSGPQQPSPLETVEPSPVVEEPPLRPQPPGRMRRVLRSAPRPTPRTILGICVSLVVVYLLLGPVTVLVAAIFQDTTTSLPLAEGNTWTLANLTRVFGAPRTWELLSTTLAFALGSLAFGGAIAVAVAWLTERTNIPFRRLIFVLVVATAGIPGLISSLGWGLLLNPAAGPVNDFLDAAFGVKVNAYSLAGMVFVQGLHLVPVLYLLVSASFRGMNPALEEAAAIFGASRWAMMRKVTLPLMAPAIVGAFIYSFVSVVESVDVPLIFGLPSGINVLATHVWLTAAGRGGLPDYGGAASYGMLLVLLALIPLIAYNRILKRSSRYVTMTGKGYRPRRTDLGAWRWPAFGLVALFLLLELVLPLFMLFWQTLQPFYGGFTAEAFDRIDFDAWTGAYQNADVRRLVWNTLKLGVMAAAATVLLTSLASWVVVRTRSRFGRWLDFMIFFPHLLSGVVIGLAVLLMYLIFPVPPVYGTVWILVIGFVIKSMPLAIRTTTPGMAQLHVSLEEVAAISGASLRQIFRRIVLPLQRPVLASAFILIFLRTISNLSLPLLLVSPGNEVLATRILSTYELGRTQTSAVLSLVMVALTTLLAIAMRFVGDGADD